MRTVFADAFFYIALLDPHESAHEAAKLACADQTIASYVTTPWVLLEVANMLASSRARRNCAAFLRELRKSPATIIVEGNDELFDRGLGLFEQRPDKEWSLTDCISFVVMGDEGLTEALTGDRHFEQAGFVALMM